MPAFMHNLFCFRPCIPENTVAEIERVQKEATIASSRLADALERIAESDDPFEDFARAARAARWNPH
jgi:hypothetical protein